MALSLKQEKFITAYLGEANGNATKAARLAGYAAPMQEGYRLLRNADISDEITRRLEESSLSKAEVLARLSDIARGIGAYVCASDCGKVTIDCASMIADGKAHLIRGVHDNKFGQVIEFADAQAALIQLGRYHKLFTDRQEITGSNGGPMNVSVTVLKEAAGELQEWRKQQIAGLMDLLPPTK